MTDEHWTGGGAPGGYITREYFGEAHARLRDELHADTRALSQRIEAVDAAHKVQLAALADRLDDLEGEQGRRVNRRWTIALALLTSFLLPLLVGVVILVINTVAGR